MTKFNLNNIRNKALVKYPYFGSITTNVNFYEDNSADTALTDGLDIYFSPKFMNKLTVKQQIFVLAHEIMHIAFNHINRSEGKDQFLWNIATDAVINAFLMEDGLPIPEGGVNIPWASKYNAEELYNVIKKNSELAQKLIDEIRKNNPDFGKNNGAGHASHGRWDPNAKKKQQQGQNSGGQCQKENNSDDKENKNGQGSGNEKDKDKQNGQGSGSEKDKEKEKNGQGNGESEEERRRRKRIENEQKEFEQEGEKNAFDKNNKDKKEQLEQMKDDINNNACHQAGNQAGEYQRRVGAIGKKSHLVDWRYFLRESIKYDLDWSYKNATIEDGVLRANLEDIPRPEVEIVLDTSGSIDAELLKNFLRECKNIMSTSKVKVGCFDTKFYGFHEVRNEYDIEHMPFEGGGGTDFNAAVGAFTKKTVNRIIFTDGYAPMPRTPMRAIWVVIGDDPIKPEGGKVIYVKRSEFDRKYNHLLIKK